ncbi:MAG: 1-deoxy-D-xylulose-5-phosphate reductoisomerase, partial [Candidatus Omnitrophica bacterium]|nr:1-deoxy-D-xylulose-5-phosphate reductoisomerase [Candidatus Omnitrophota bacterium]
MKKVVIFGSTGSIGKNALEVIRKDRQRFEIIGLCANRDTKTLYSQIKEFSPSYVCVADETKAKELKDKLSKKIKFFSGQEGLKEFASLKSDISLMAISGISCLEPLLINIKHAKRIALANKESIVVGGYFVFRLAKEFNTEVLPVDSEINALYQIMEQMQTSKSDSFKKVYLTASGGSLYHKKDFLKVGIKEVLSHPTWKMGKRITVDSATLVNKGFETIESHYFFNLPYKKIDILIHRESI